MKTVTKWELNNIYKMVEHKIKTKDLKNNHTIRIKFSADGKIVSRKVKLLNLTFILINEGNKAKTATLNYIYIYR